MSAPNLSTKRLLLRQWKESDLDFFAQMNADPNVMEFFPSTLSRQESDDLAERIRKELSEKEYGFWAIEVIGTAPFIGFVGLHQPDIFSSIEIGWRIAHEHWRKGYALEAAQKAVEYAFTTLKLPEIISFTTTTNFRSRGLMKKLGMTHDSQDDFSHPKLPENHPLSPHVLCRLTSKSFFNMKALCDASLY